MSPLNNTLSSFYVMVSIRNLETPPKKGNEPRKHWGRYLHPMVLLGYTQSWTIPTTPQWWICTAGLLYVLDFTAAKCFRPNFFGCCVEPLLTVAPRLRKLVS